MSTYTLNAARWVVLSKKLPANDASLPVVTTRSDNTISGSVDIYIEGLTGISTLDTSMYRVLAPTGTITQWSKIDGRLEDTTNSSVSYTGITSDHQRIAWQFDFSGITGSQSSQYYGVNFAINEGAGITGYTYTPSIVFKLYDPIDYTGLTGAFGNSLFGITGPQGHTGAMGMTGVGVTGMIGATGQAGSTGSQGHTGAVGPKGDTGTQGIQGEAGLGVTGLIGPTGAVGTQGITGAQGNQGASGVQGITGSVGIQGITGPIGATGAAGAQGPTGAVGAQGNQGGETGTINIFYNNHAAIAPFTGLVGEFQMPSNFSIYEWSVRSSETGYIKTTVSKQAQSDYIPKSGDTNMSGLTGVWLNGQIKNSDDTNIWPSATGASDDIIDVWVNYVTGVSNISISLKYMRY
jgi:hypothetical protein